MAITKQKKSEILTNLKDMFSRAKAVIFADFTGLSVPDFQDLKKKVEETQGDLTIAKNTLIDLAIKDSPYSDYSDKKLELFGPTAALIAYKDPLKTVKVLAQFIKEKELPKIKIGLVEGRTLDEAGVISLSKIPTREVLLAQLVGYLQSPVASLAYTLQEVQRNLVYTLNEVTKKRV